MWTMFAGVLRAYNAGRRRGMREAEVRALLVDPATRSPVLLLKDRNSTKAMPIWIAEPEAMSIALELQGQRFPAPFPTTS